jgi:hypothetical protein
VEVAKRQILGLGANAEAGYAPETPWPATALVARAADGSFRIEWDTAKMELQAIGSAEGASGIPLPVLHGDAKGDGGLPKGSVPLCFLSTDGSHVIVNTLFPNAAGELPWRTVALLRRTSPAKSPLNFEPVAKEPFDTAVWKYFCNNTGLGDAEVGPADAQGQRQRGIYVMEWTDYEPEVQLFVLAKVEHGGAAAEYYMGIVMYDAKKEHFEKIIVKKGDPGKLRQPWPEKKAVGATAPQPSVVEGSFSDFFRNIDSEVLGWHMSDMEKNYGRLLKVLPPEETSNLDTEQRQWMEMRPTLAYVETLRGWSVFPCSGWAKGLADAIDARRDDLDGRINKTGKARSNQAITNVSPDGRCALRQTFDLTDAKQENRPLMAELVDVATKQRLLVLMDADMEPQMNYNVEMIWSPDSSAFAFSSSGRRDRFVEVAKKIGGKFVPLQLPKKAKGQGKTAVSYDFGGSEAEGSKTSSNNEPAFALSVQGIMPKHWLKNGDLEAEGESSREMTSKSGTRYTMVYSCTLTLSFDKKQQKLLVKSVTHEKQEAQ